MLGLSKHIDDNFDRPTNIGLITGFPVTKPTPFGIAHVNKS